MFGAEYAQSRSASLEILASIPRPWGNIIGVIQGIMEKKMETTIMGFIGPTVLSWI